MEDFATLVMGAETRGLKKGEKALDDVVGAAGRAEDAVDGVSDGFDHAGDAAKRAKPKLKEGADQTDRVASGAAKAAKALRAFALGYVSLQAVGGGISMARDFNAAIAETSTLIEGTPEQLKMISNEARSMARAFGGDGKAQVEAFYQAISAGAGTVEQSAALLDQANRLAIGGVTDVTTATGILSAATNVYVASGLTAAEASDALFVAMKQGTTTIGELSSSLGKVLPLAEKLGVNFDEVAAATAALTKGGITTAESVTGLRASLAAILAPSAEAQKLALKLGIQFNSAGLEAKGFAGFMSDVVDKTGGSNEALQTLFSSIEATGAVLSLSGAAGQYMAENLELMAKKSGMTEAAFLKMSSSLDQRWNRATAAGRDAMLVFGNAALAVVVPALEAVVTAGGFVAENIDSIAVAIGALALTQLPGLAVSAYTAVTAISIMELQFIAGAVAARGMAVAASAARVALALLGGPIGIAVGAATALAGALLLANDRSEALVVDAREIAEKYRLAVGDMQLMTTAKQGQAEAEAEIKAYLDQVVIASGGLTKEMAQQYSWAAKTRTESDRAAAIAKDLLIDYRQQAEFSRLIAEYGADSIQASDYQHGIERAALATKLKALGVSENMQREILGAADAAYQAELAADALAGKIANAASNAAILASNLGAAARGVEQTAEKQIAVIQARIDALGAGQDVYLASSRAALQIDKDRYHQALLTSGATEQAAQLATERNFENQDAVIRLTAAERALASSIKATGKASSGSSSSTLVGLLSEINQRKTLLGLTDDQRKKYQAILSVRQRLGKEAGKYSKARIDALAHELVSLDATEAALQRVSDRQQQWSENITRTAFENGSLGDTTKGMLKDIAFQFAHSKVVLPVVASVTSILGLDQLIGGGGQALGAGGGGSGGGGLGMGGNLLSTVLGGSTFMAGVSGGASAALGLGGYVSSGMFAVGANAAVANAAVASAATGASALASTIGAALPVVGIALAGIYALSKALSRKYAGTAIRGSLGAGGFTGDQFDFYKGGALRSNKETHKPLAAELQAMLDTTMMGVSKGLTGMALSLGLGTAALADFNDEQFTLWTQGKDAAQIQQELQVQIAATSDEMAALILDTEQFSRTGEGASDTLSRLSGGLLAVNDMADLLGRTSFAVSLHSADAASNLVDAFGGLEAMSGAVNTYWAAFYSDADRSDTTLRRLSDTFADLGVTMPQSRDGFRDLVTGMDLTTESGRQMYAQVVSLSGAMDQVLPKVGQFTAAMSGLLDRIGGQIGVQIDAARGLASDSKSAASLWYRTATTLRSFLGDLIKSDLTAASRGQVGALNQSRFQSAFQMARGGDIDAARGIPALAKSYLSSIRASAGTDLEYRRMAAQVQGQVKFLAGIAELEGANKDVLQTLYEQQIEVLTGLGNFLQLEGLTGVQIEGLDQSIQDMAANWDGTVATFDTSLTSLEGAIREAELFSYDYLKERLKVAVDLLPSATIPAYLQTLIGQAESGITASIDFIVRSDLAAPMKWLAVNSASEHIKSLDFILRSDVSSETRVLSLATGSELRRNIRLVVTQDLDPDSRRIALAGNSELSRVVNVALDQAGSDPGALNISLRNIGGYAVAVSAAFDPGISAAVRRVVLDQSGSYGAMIEASLTLLDGDARRILLTQQGSYVTSINGVLAANMAPSTRHLLINEATTAVRRISLDTLGLTAQQQSLIDAISGASSGTITLAGTYRFAPEGAFQTWFSGTTRAHIVAPMLLLRENLDQLREAVNQDRWARHNAAEKQRQIGVITAAAAGVSGSLADNQQWAVNLVAKVEALQLQTGTQLRLGNGAGVLGLNRDGSINYNADGVTGGDVAAFGAQFWGQGGLQDYMARANTNIGSSGAQLEAYRAQVTALGGVPGFAAGGAHSGGWRMVGERGPELEYTGPSRVVSNSDAKSMLDNSAVVAELRALKAEIATFRREQLAVGGQTASNTRNTADRLLVLERQS